MLTPRSPRQPTTAAIATLALLALGLPAARPAAAHPGAGPAGDPDTPTPLAATATPELEPSSRPQTAGEGLDPEAGEAAGDPAGESTGPGRRLAPSQAVAPPAPHLLPCVERFAALTSGARLSPRSMIATLPDPLDSPFGRELDVLFLAVQQAMEAERFVQDRACLAWGEPGDPTAPGAARLYREQPSVVLFRRATDERRDGQVYALLVVGEVPHSGVQAGALARALELVEPGGPFAAAPEDGRPGTVRILGPTFSGSAESLAAALDSWRWRPAAPSRRPRLVVRSGTATNSGLTELFSEGLSGSADRLDLVAFQSRGTSNDDLQSCAWNRLVPRRIGLRTRWQPAGADLPQGHPCTPDPLASGDDNPRVALLVESSAYGSQFAESGFRVASFPTHVAALRNAYEEVRGQGRKPAPQPDGGSGAVENLPFELRAPALQGMPAFGKLATLNSQDLVLNQTLRRLARDRVQLIAIIATSTEDKLFLAEKVRTFAPDVRLLTFEGDVLLTHPETYGATAGMLVVSSHPLIEPDPATPRGGGRQPVDLQFALDGAQGLFLATRDLLTDDFGEPRHRVWTSVVSRTGLVPFDRFDLPLIGDGVAAGHGNGGGGDEVAGSSAETGPADRRQAAATAAAAGPPADRAGTALAAAAPFGFGVAPSELPTMWKLLLFLVSLLLGVGAVTVRRDLGAGRSLLGLVPTDLVKPSRWRRPQERDRILHAVVVLLPVALGVVYFVLAFPALTAQSSAELESMAVAGLPGNLLGLIAGACLVMLLAASLYLLTGLAIRTVQDLRREVPKITTATSRLHSLLAGGRIAAPLAVASALTLLLVASGWRSIDRIWTDPGAGGSLLVRRALTLSGGVSPLLPTLLIAGVAVGWVLLALHRREVLHRIAPRHQHLEAGDCRALWRAIDPLADGPAVGRWWVALVLVPMLYLSSLYGHRLAPVLRSIEGPGFDRGITALLALAILVCVAAGVSLLRGWQVLRDFVRGIAGQVDLEQVVDPRREPSTERLRALLDRHPEPAAPGGEAARGEGERAPATARLAAGLGQRGAGLASHWLAVAEWRRATSGAETADQPAGLAEAAAGFHAEGAAHLVWVAVGQLRRLMVFLTVALLALFFAAGTYPFEPRRMIFVYLGALIVLAASLCVAIVVSADRDSTLVRLAGTGVGGSGWPALVQRLGFFAGLPALSLLAGRFPELRQLLGEWLAPLVDAVK